jgi:hypothetical protein
MAVGIHLAARRDQAPARKPANSGLFAKSPEISVRVRLRGGAGRSPTLGEINGLQMVRVEITPLNAKEDFAATRTLRRSDTSYSNGATIWCDREQARSADDQLHQTAD